MKVRTAYVVLAMVALCSGPPPGRAATIGFEADASQDAVGDLVLSSLSLADDDGSADSFSVGDQEEIQVGNAVCLPPRTFPSLARLP